MLFDLLSKECCVDRGLVPSTGTEAQGLDGFGQVGEVPARGAVEKRAEARRSEIIEETAAERNQSLVFMPRTVARPDVRTRAGARRSRWVALVGVALGPAQVVGYQGMTLTSRLWVTGVAGEAATVFSAMKVGPGRPRPMPA